MKVIKLLAFAVLSFSAIATQAIEGRFGARVTSDVLPNFVNLIFGSDISSRATETELKMAAEELQLSLKHARAYISAHFAKNQVFNSSIKRTMEDIENLEKNIADGKKWRSFNETQKYEFATNYIRESFESKNKYEVFDENKYSKLIYITIKRFEGKYSKATNDADKISLSMKKDDLKKYGSYNHSHVEELMRMIELSPETVAYFYSKYSQAMIRKSDLRRPTLNQEIDEHLSTLKTNGIIQEQAFAVSMKKAKLNKIALRLAAQNKFRDWTESQNLKKLCNSIFLEGFTRHYETDNSISSYLNVNLSRQIGDIVEIFEGPSKNSMGVLINTTTIMQAQATKKVISGLFKLHSIGGDMRTLDFLANPSKNSIYNANRVVSEKERALQSGISSEVGSALFSYIPWKLYEELLIVSLECDDIVKQAMISNIRNEDNAMALYNSKIKDLLGNTIKAEGSYYYNF